MDDDLFNLEDFAKKEISDNNRNINITIENAPEAPPAVIVPDTSTTSVLLTIFRM